jgi:hypothetical protein
MGEYGVKVKPNILGMLLVVGLIGLLVIYFSVFISSRDPVWFVKGFAEQPSRIVVYNQGQPIELKPGDPGFELLAGAIVDSLDQGVARLSGIGMSDASQQDAYDKYLTVEAFFRQPIKLHTWFNTGNPTQLLFPITGRHSDLQVVLLGSGGRYAVNVPALNTVEPLRQALKSLGYDIED